MNVDSLFVARFEDIGEADVARIGWKNARLGMVLRSVGPLGVAIPPGFAISTDAFEAFVKHNALGPVIAHAMATLRPDGQGARQTSEMLRAAVLRSTVPAAVAAPVLAAYRRLGALGIDRVAVRVSAPEPLGQASLGGAHLHVVGEAALLDAVRACWASRFDEASVRHWAARGLHPHASPVALAIQQMVRSDLGAAGTMSWSICSKPDAYDVAITASWGLGGRVDSGGIEPDTTLLRVPRRSSDRAPTLLTTRPGSKLFKIVYDAEAGEQRCVPTTLAEHEQEVLSHEERTTLARWGVLIAGHCPSIAQVDWAKDGRTGAFFVLEARAWLTPDKAAFWKNADLAPSVPPVRFPRPGPDPASSPAA
jgi:pyruvate, water dikinase